MFEQEVLFFEMERKFKKRALDKNLKINIKDEISR